MTLEQIERARELRRANPRWSLDRIACSMGVSEYRLRCELEPDYREKKRLEVRRNRAKKQPKRGPYTGRKVLAHSRQYQSPDCEPCNHRVDDLRNIVPPAVLFDRDWRHNLPPRDMTAAVCGDPLPGYSALDRLR